MKRRDLLSGIVAFLSFGLVEKASKASPSKEKASKWLEEIEKESKESYLKRLENITKAHEILRKYSNFTTQEAECVRKAICKGLKDEQYKKYKNDFIQTGWNYSVELNKVHIWDAICITYRTAGREDGFQLIDCEFPKNVEQYKDIAQFKTINLYPTLL